MTDTIRIALGDDSLIVREGIGHLLAGDPEMEVVATVGDLPALREVCDRERPDVVVVDIRMPPTNTDDGIRLATELRDRHPDMGVVVLSQFSERGPWPGSGKSSSSPGAWRPPPGLSPRPFRGGGCCSGWRDCVPGVGE